MYGADDIYGDITVFGRVFRCCDVCNHCNVTGNGCSRYETFTIDWQRYMESLLESGLTAFRLV